MMYIYRFSPILYNYTCDDFRFKYDFNLAYSLYIYFLKKWLIPTLFLIPFLFFFFHCFMQTKRKLGYLYFIFLKSAVIKKHIQIKISKQNYLNLIFIKIVWIRKQNVRIKLLSENKLTICALWNLQYQIPREKI